MEKNHKAVSQAQGAEDTQETPVTVEQVKKYLVKDVSIALSCLDAIASDPDLLDVIAHFMHGRYMNNLAAKSKAAQ